MSMAISNIHDPISGIPHIEVNVINSILDELDPGNILGGMDIYK